MKRKEKEELKHDVFVETVEKVFKYLIDHKKALLSILTLAVILAAVIFSAFYFKNRQVKRWSEEVGIIYSLANDVNLSINERILKLEDLKYDGDARNLSLILQATLRYQNGELQKAQELANAVSDSSRPLLNQQRELLKADLYLSQDKKNEARLALENLLKQKNLQLAEDYLLLKLSQLQVSINDKENALINLRKLISEYPQSTLQEETQKLLNSLEKN